uniref:Venom protein n=1 Tax=Rhabditophanes sp. KR3021 TaxID=114890 RepID=A0AC35UDA9_9BILA
MVTRLSLLFALFFIGTSEATRFFLYKNCSTEHLQNAQELGENARIFYVKNAMTMDDMQKRELYLQGLEVCNSIDSDEVVRVQKRCHQECRHRDARLLEQIGMKQFQAQFMTLPVDFMKEVAHMACSKHEQQLQCGANFEGNEMIEKRIEDLKNIGNHKMMFLKECREPNYVPTVYPCVGKLVKQWASSCLNLMSDYYSNQQSVNAQIASIYDTAINTVKKIREKHSVNHPIELQQFVFTSSMTKIAKLEGDKCAKFKKMKSCVLPALERQCGPEARSAVDMGITLGYLRTERHERLHMDFENFHFPTDARCDGL